MPIHGTSPANTVRNERKQHKRFCMTIRMSSFNFTETTQSKFFMHKRKLNLSSLMTHKIQARTRVSMATQYSMNVCFVYQFTGFAQVIPHNDFVLSFCCYSHIFSIYFVSTIPSFFHFLLVSFPLSLLQSSDIWCHIQLCVVILSMSFWNNNRFSVEFWW